jgi:dipeptidyl aminopeptidase/acylaminoacyl peptidase
MAWSPDGRRLAVGFADDSPDRRGDIVIYERLSGAQSLGCSVSRWVIAWPTRTRLVVSDGQNMHLVSAEDCSTIHSIDARKMHHITVSPDGQKMAYIFRDLVYNRERRAYDPDSSLLIADIDGTNAESIAGYRYRPRNMTWSSDGSALAFDVDSQDEPSRRLVSIYDLGTNQSVFLNPGSVGYSETRPRWAPAGADVAFQRHDADGNLEACVRKTGENFVRVLGAGVLEGWVSETLLLVSEPADSLLLVTSEAEEVARLQGPAKLIAGR